MGVEICFRHLHNELSFSYTSFDNFIACLQTYIPKEYWSIIGCLSWESNISEKEYYGPHGKFKAECGTIYSPISVLKYVLNKIPKDHGFYRDVQRFLDYCNEEIKYENPEVWVNC